MVRMHPAQHQEADRWAWLARTSLVLGLACAELLLGACTCIRDDLALMSWTLRILGNYWVGEKDHMCGAEIITMRVDNLRD